MPLFIGTARQKATVELMEMVPGCDAKAVFRHLDDEIILKLNREYAEI
jgi:hypothetical protein